MSLLTTAAAAAYTFRATDALPFYALKRRKAQKQRGFRAKSTYGHCIKDEVLIDPAAGSGNFLTETYICLRQLEFAIISELKRGKNIGMFDSALEGDVEERVKLSQFYGIEINDFAVAVAETALWISRLKANQEAIIVFDLDEKDFPLEERANIICENALRFDWKDLIDPTECSYIMGNPPFVAKTGRTSAQDTHSAAMMSIDQKKEKEQFFEKNVGLLDYVACWFMKAALYTEGTHIVSSFVATSSICQGQQVEPLWSALYEKGIHIKYAYTSFKWTSGANDTAYVYVVIVGFSHDASSVCKLFTSDSCKLVSHINPYLVDGDDILIETRNIPLCNVPMIGIGNKPIDNGFYLFTEEEKLDFLSREPLSQKYFKSWVGAEEFLKNKKRYCLWLGDCSEQDLLSMPECMKRVESVRSFRLSSKSEGTRKIAAKPTRFHVENMPRGRFIVIPEVSSGSRKYIPMGYMDDEVLCSNKLRLMPDATLYHFGVLESIVHMSWMRTIGGYFGPSYQYSVNIVYNNFPWCTTTDELKANIEQTAQEIINARNNHSDKSLSDLYDPIKMPDDLKAAHDANDKAVMDAYGFSYDMTEPEIVAELMKMYQKLTEVK